MTVTPWIVLLSGASSSGKSSLGRALLAQVPRPTVMIEADAAFPEIHGWPAGSDLRPPIVVFHRSVMAWFNAGANVILDGSLPYGDIDLRQECLNVLPPSRTFIVAVKCSVDELRRREASRPDERQIGWAEQQARDVNDGLDAIVTIDTTEGAVEDHAHQALAAIAAAW